MENGTTSSIPGDYISCKGYFLTIRYCERWIRSVKTQLLSKMILIGERSLRHCLENYVAHFHAERYHQGKDNVILIPEPEDHLGESTGSIQTRERLGGLLKFYYPEAA